MEITPEKYGVMVEPIIEEFKKLHPEVSFEDIMTAPMAVSMKKYPYYFASLGNAEELNKKYYYGDYVSYEGQTYGLPIGVVYEGILYNQIV